MRIEAIFSAADLAKLARDFFPLVLRLGEDGELALSLLEDATLIEAQGLHMRCSGQLKWSVLGVAVPITIKDMSTVLSPAIEQRAGRGTLVFTLQISQLDVALVPGVLDAKIEELVNAELLKKRSELAWDFSTTLSHAFALPTSMVAPNEIALRVLSGKLDVGAAVLALSISFHANVGRKAPSPR